MTDPSKTPSQDRIAKVIARAGLCSRREAEAWIAEGRVAVNGRTLTTPAVTVGPRDEVSVDGRTLPAKERTRLWLYHKPRGLVTTARDPQGRPTVFERLPAQLPRVISVGRLDINTEGLLLLTNDGGLARVLELPATGWLRKYRVRVHGQVAQADLDRLKDGIAVEGVLYGSIQATLDQVQGSNAWITMGLREGKNREVKNVLAALGLQVTRLIRVSFGPFQLGDMPLGEVSEVPGRTLRDQLGRKLSDEAGADFTTPISQRPARTEAGDAPARPKARGGRTMPPKRAGGRSDTERPARPYGDGAPGRRDDRGAGKPGARPDRTGRTGEPRRGERTDAAGERPRRPGGRPFSSAPPDRAGTTGDDRRGRTGRDRPASSGRGGKPGERAGGEGRSGPARSHGPAKTGGKPPSRGGPRGASGGPRGGTTGKPRGTAGAPGRPRGGSGGPRKPGSGGGKGPRT